MKVLSAIQDEEQYQNAMAHMDWLMDQDSETGGANEDEVEALTVAIKHYENISYHLKLN